MPDLSEEKRMPTPCPECGSHRVRLSEVHNPTDKVFCSSCNTLRGEYSDLEKELLEKPRSEAEELLEAAANSKKRSE
ncbi:hypothetical protein [Kushneria phosphatilytica]|uniref:Uncharacterized protein n=1 Tax=Kushneria phosphatilytica TaxID=657387 RepID=A0A1S1P055_9GAMM|nr:hypothetical protein [Kushneria phosphatilytica]OHV12828.1 hypothetical protein BH688_01975 [Kushneria phosphatilytica]QEL10677.1 hypothetical protein FY550_05740 [Kushneria phosphatilytica]